MTRVWTGTRPYKGAGAVARSKWNDGAAMHASRITREFEARRCEQLAEAAFSKGDTGTGLTYLRAAREYRS